jgi:hypothetical protein
MSDMPCGKAITYRAQLFGGTQRSGSMGDAFDGVLQLPLIQLLEVFLDSVGQENAEAEKGSG